MVDGDIIVRASFPQGWRGSRYDKGDPMPATQKQARRLTASGQAYYDFQEVPDLEVDFEDLPEHELLAEAGYDTLDAVAMASDEQLREINGIGPKTLAKIRGFYAGDGD